MKKRNFYESLRNTFLRNALMSILVLVVLWGAGMMIYNIYTVQYNTHAINREVSEVIHNQYVAYVEMLLEASGNDEVIKAAVNGESDTKVNGLLYHFATKQNIRSIFYLFSREGSLIASNTWSARKGNQLDSGYTINQHFNKDMINKIKSSESGVFCKRYYRETQGRRDCIYSMAAPVGNRDGAEGYLVFEWLESDMLKYMDTQYANYLVITDEYYYAIASSDKRILSPISKFRPSEKASGIVNINGTRMYMVSSANEGGPFIVFSLTTLKTTEQMLLFGILFIMATSLLLWIIMLHLSKRIAQKNTAYLDELIAAVEELKKGNYSYKMKEDGRADEFAYLCSQYRLLVDRIRQLLELNQRLSDMNRNAEIKQLQAQFNPHLIFNTLENIKYVIYIKPEKAEKMISLLARLLRYSIKNGDDMVILKHDIEYIKAYLELQKERYDSRLSYSIEIEDAIMDIHIPKLILQPLVENCINHGYRNKDTLDIRLAGTFEGSSVKLTVSDNGDGMTPERLSYIWKKLESQDADTDNIGLLNSHKRLQLIYGPEYGLMVESIPGTGTQVTAVIPAGTRCDSRMKGGL